jgi:hypothetical protein
MPVTDVTIGVAPTAILDKADGRGSPPVLFNAGGETITLTFGGDTDTFALEAGQLIQAKADQDVSGTVAAGTETLQILEGIEPIGIGGTPGVDHTGFIAIGSGTPDKIASVAGDLYVSNQLEVDGTAFFDGTIQAGTVLPTDLFFGGGVSGGGLAHSNDDGMLLIAGKFDGITNHHIIMTSSDWLTRDHDHDIQSTDPTLFVHSATDPNTDNTEFARVRWNDFAVGAGKGAFVGVRTISEEVTVAIGTGAAGVASAGNIAPANALILAAVFRVIQAPGNAALTLDIGRTGGGNLDELIDGASCDTLGESGNTAADRAADTTQMPIVNGAADTVTLTTDANVTGTDMIVRVAVFYIDLIEPTS